MELTPEIKRWLENDFKNWLESNYGVTLSIVIDGKTVMLEFEYNGRKNVYDFKDDDQTELTYAIENVGIGIENDENIKHFFKIDESQYLTFVDTVEDLEIKRDKYQFYLNRDKDKSVNIKISSNINFTILFIVIKNQGYLEFDFNAADNEFETQGDFLSLFKANILEMTFNNKVDDSLAVHICLSCLFEINALLDEYIIPVGINLVKFNELDLNKTISYEIDPSHPTVPKALLKYDLEPLVYYFAAHWNYDLRYQYLDFYHVIEFYFEKIVIERTLLLINEKLKDPQLFYDDKVREDFAKLIKKEYVRDKKATDYDEIVQLSKSIEKYIKSVNFTEFIEHTKVLPELRELALKSVNLSDRKVMEIQSRIYSLRNSIAHSKSDEKNRIKPNSIVLESLDDDLDIICDISEYLLRSFASNYEL